ncbi:MAG: hypothetical protein ABEJ35_03875 [Halobacteriaceae archaeon]
MDADAGWGLLMGVGLVLVLVGGVLSTPGVGPGGDGQTVAWMALVVVGVAVFTAAALRRAPDDEGLE